MRTLRVADVAVAPARAISWSETPPHRAQTSKRSFPEVGSVIRTQRYVGSAATRAALDGLEMAGRKAPLSKLNAAVTVAALTLPAPSVAT